MSARLGCVLLTWTCSTTCLFAGAFLQWNGFCAVCYGNCCCSCLEALTGDLLVFNQVLTSSCFLPEGRTSVESASTPRTNRTTSSRWRTFVTPWRSTGTPKTKKFTGPTSPPTPSTAHCGTARDRKLVTVCFPDTLHKKDAMGKVTCINLQIQLYRNCECEGERENE